MKKLIVFALIMLSTTAFTDDFGKPGDGFKPGKPASKAGFAPASPARWTLAPHIAPLAVNPNMLFEMGSVSGNPLPQWSRFEKAHGKDVFEIQTYAIKDNVANTTLYNSVNGLMLHVESVSTYDEAGRLKGVAVTTSEGERDSCELSYEREDRLIKRECTTDCTLYHYDKKGRVTRVYESMSNCGDWHSTVGYTYTGENTVPATVNYCADDKLQDCYERNHVAIDSRGLVTSLERIEGEESVSVETFSYDDRGLLIRAQEVDSDGEVIAEERFSYDAAGEKLLSKDYDGRSTSYTTTFFYNCPDTQNYTAERFFEDVESRYIATEDEISADQKAAIITSGFRRGSEVCENLEGSSDGYFESWYVDENKDSFLKLGRCGTGSSVEIHLYKHKYGGSIAAVVSKMGNHGQSQEFRFFRIPQQGRLMLELTLEDLNLLDQKENEFLSLSQQLPEEQNESANFHMNHDGVISAIPWTWMQPRWEHREMINEIWFEWNGEKFIKHIKKTSR